MARLPAPDTASVIGYLAESHLCLSMVVAAEPCALVVVVRMEGRKFFRQAYGGFRPFHAAVWRDPAGEVWMLEHAGQSGAIAQY